MRISDWSSDVCSSDLDPTLVTLRSLSGFLGLALVALAASAVHLTQGTSEIGLADLLDLAIGRGDQLTRDVFMGSRLPRLLAGVVVGLAVGVSGALLQSVTRNPLASPDTLAINGGAWFAATLVAAFGVSLPLIGQGSVAFAGGLVGAGVVLALSGGASGPARLVLAGSARSEEHTSELQSLMRPSYAVSC